MLHLDRVVQLAGGPEVLPGTTTDRVVSNGTVYVASYQFEESSRGWSVTAFTLP